MKRRLNVSVIQMPLGDMADNLSYISKSVEALMGGYTKPELIVGVEFGITTKPTPISGEIEEYFSALSAKHGVYLIPGTMAESSPELKEGEFYNTCPIFGPDGSLIATYRKKTPFRPGEASVPSSDPELCTFKIKEKNITVGVLICYEQFFPEIPRALALQGAELLICPALDPMEFAHIPDILPRARALENEAYYIWTCGAGSTPKSTLCGKSTFVDPEGMIMHQCDSNPSIITKTLDFDKVTEKRLAGSDQHLNSLRSFIVPTPFAGRVSQAPVYNNMPELTQTPKEYMARLKEMELSTFEIETK